MAGGPRDERVRAGSARGEEDSGVWKRAISACSQADALGRIPMPHTSLANARCTQIEQPRSGEWSGAWSGLAPGWRSSSWSWSASTPARFRLAQARWAHPEQAGAFAKVLTFAGSIARASFASWQFAPCRAGISPEKAKATTPKRTSVHRASVRECWEREGMDNRKSTESVVVPSFACRCNAVARN